MTPTVRSLPGSPISGRPLVYVSLGTLYSGVRGPEIF